MGGLWAITRLFSTNGLHIARMMVTIKIVEAMICGPSLIRLLTGGAIYVLLQAFPGSRICIDKIQVPFANNSCAVTLFPEHFWQ
jgi:hypothetical protein